MAKSSKKTFRFFANELPSFSNVPQLLSEGFLTKAHRTNWDYVKDTLQVKELSDTQRLMMVDPQTSGGLLVAADPSAQLEVQKVLERYGLQEHIQPVGRFTAKGEFAVSVVGSR